MLQEDEGRPESVFLGVFQMLPYQEGPGRWAGARAGGWREGDITSCGSQGEKDLILRQV